MKMALRGGIVVPPPPMFKVDDDEDDDDEVQDAEVEFEEVDQFDAGDDCGDGLLLVNIRS